MLMGILIGIVLSFDMVAMAIAMGSGAALALLGALGRDRPGRPGEGLVGGTKPEGV